MNEWSLDHNGRRAVKTDNNFEFRRQSVCHPILWLFFNKFLLLLNLIMMHHFFPDLWDVFYVLKGEKIETLSKPSNFEFLERNLNITEIQTIFLTRSDWTHDLCTFCTFQCPNRLSHWISLEVIARIDRIGILRQSWDEWALIMNARLMRGPSRQEDKQI